MQKNKLKFLLGKVDNLLGISPEQRKWSIKGKKNVATLVVSVVVRMMNRVFTHAAIAGHLVGVVLITSENVSSSLDCKYHDIMLETTCTLLYISSKINVHC